MRCSVMELLLWSWFSIRKVIAVSLLRAGILQIALPSRRCRVLRNGLGQIGHDSGQGGGKGRLTFLDGLYVRIEDNLLVDVRIVLEGDFDVHAGRLLLLASGKRECRCDEGATCKILH